VDKVIATKIPMTLYKRLQKYKEERCIESDSEALREILRNYLLGDDNGRR